MKTIKLQYYILICFLCVNCTNRGKNAISNTLSDNKTIYKVYTDDIEPIEKNEAYYKSKGYQVFSEYQLAVKCPTLLRNISGQSSENFDFNYAGNTNNVFYQVAIIKLSADRKKMSKSEYKELFESRGGGKYVLWGEEELPAFLLNDYVQNGYRGRGIAVGVNGMIYTFNVMSKNNIDADFNSFTNDVYFFYTKEEPIITSESEISKTENNISLDENEHTVITELYGFRLGQYKHTTKNEFGEPFQGGKFEDESEYEMFFIDSEKSIYMVFIYSKEQNKTIESIQLSGDNFMADIGFYGLRLGIDKEKVEKVLGKPYDKKDIGEYGEQWNYENKNYSIEISHKGKLSSVKIWDTYSSNTSIMGKRPEFESIIKLMSSNNNTDIGHILAPTVEIYYKGQTLCFEKSFGTEIKTDFSGIFQTIREIINGLDKINTYDPNSYEENMRVVLGQNMKHVVKIKKGHIIQEIVFENINGQYLIYEIHANNNEGIEETKKSHSPEEPAISKLNNNLQKVSELNTYINRPKGFSIDFPKGWEVNENVKQYAEVVILAPENGSTFRSNFNIIVSHRSESLDRLFQLSQQQITNSNAFAGYKLNEKEYVSINGIGGIKTIASYRLSGYAVKGIQYILKKSDNTVFTISFTIGEFSYLNEKNLVENIIQSFKTF